MAFKADELMTQIAPGGWMVACEGGTEPEKDTPFCQEDSQYHCRTTHTRNPCGEETCGPCQGDTQPPPCAPGTQPEAPPREAGSSGLALLRQQMRELLSN